MLTETNESGNSNYPKIARQLWQAGYEPIPIAPKQKYPTIKSWPDIRLPIKPWPKDHGVGIRTGKITAIDIDCYDAEVVAVLLGCFKGLNILTRVGQPPKTLIPLFCPELAGKATSDKYLDGEGRINQIELLSQGQQFVAFGIHPGTERPYEWSGSLVDYAPPCIPMTLIDYLFSALDEQAKKRGWQNISIVESRPRIRKSKPSSGNKPGDIYNRACKIQDVLTEYGWHHHRGDYWTRPGKKHGISGTVFDDNTFWCFSSSTCLIPDRSYDPFGLLAFYEFSGSFEAAANALKEVA